MEHSNVSSELTGQTRSQCSTELNGNLIKSVSSRVRPPTVFSIQGCRQPVPSPPTHLCRAIAAQALSFRSGSSYPRFQQVPIRFPIEKEFRLAEGGYLGCHFQLWFLQFGHSFGCRLGASHS